jgi:hypothetical protein
MHLFTSLPRLFLSMSVCLYASVIIIITIIESAALVRGVLCARAGIWNGVSSLALWVALLLGQNYGRINCMLSRTCMHA